MGTLAFYCPLMMLKARDTFLTYGLLISSETGLWFVVSVWLTIPGDLVTNRLCLGLSWPCSRTLARPAHVVICLLLTELTATNRTGAFWASTLLHCCWFDRVWLLVYMARTHGKIFRP